MMGDSLEDANDDVPLRQADLHADLRQAGRERSPGAFHALVKRAKRGPLAPRYEQSYSTTLPPRVVQLTTSVVCVQPWPLQAF